MNSGQIRFTRAARGVRWSVPVILLLAAADARAHLVSTELGPFYDGAAHPLVSVEDLLTIVGFAILAGHAGRIAGRRSLVVFILSWALGVLAGFAMAPGRWDLPLGTAGVILVLGLAGALKVRVPTGILVWGAGVAGLGHGLLNGSAVAADGGRWLTAAGIVGGVIVLGTLLTGLCSWLQEKRTAVLLRVASSWVAAIGLLMLGWQIRG
jgi:hydrogenase/urease accessory protein HupE